MFDTATKKQDDLYCIRDQMKQSGIFLCDAKCPLTARPCRGKFLLAAGLAKHTMISKHDFPVGIRSMDQAALLASSAGGPLAAGSRLDRMEKVVQRPILESFEGSLALEDAICFGQFNRIDKRHPYRKPDKLKKQLEKLFDVTPKLNANQMYEELRKMADPDDGGLMFCHSKRGTHVAKTDPAYKNWPGCLVCKANKSCVCNGMLPSVAMIHTFISGQTQRNKKNRTERDN